jgi:MFS family permease
MSDSKWLRIGGTLMFGLFVAYLDRSNLSVGLPAIAKELGFDGPSFSVTSSLALTMFLVGYAFANVFGGMLTQRFDPKWTAIVMIAIWSIATIMTGFASSISLILGCRLALGIAEGVYWPQQSRFARTWFSPEELTKANSVIQYYGQYLALALGFIILMPIYNSWGWRSLFYLTGAVGLLLVVPLYIRFIKPEREAAKLPVEDKGKGKLTLKALGGASFFLIVLSYLAQGMFFWGITLWIPLAVKSLGFNGMMQAVGSALPYIAALLLAIPMASISDRTGKRGLIASLGLILPGCLLVFLPFVESGGWKLMMITVAMGYYASSYTPNIWAIIQSTVDRSVVGSAAGIVNGIGAGGGGTIAGFVVGLLLQSTGSYVAGFTFLGGVAILGGIALIIYTRIHQLDSKKRSDLSKESELMTIK